MLDSLYLELSMVDSLYLENLYLELSLSQTNSLVPCEFEIETVKYMKFIWVYFSSYCCRTEDSSQNISYYFLLLLESKVKKLIASLQSCSTKAVIAPQLAFVSFGHEVFSLTGPILFMSKKFCCYWAKCRLAICTNILLYFRPNRH